MALVVKMIQGEPVDLGLERDKEVDAKVLSHKAGVVYQVGYYTDLSKIPEGSVAMLNIMGPVTKFGDICSYGSVDHTATINALAKANNIAGIILNVDSPGGEAAGTSMLADAIRNAGSIKPVIGVVDDGIAASAGYWILSSCSEVYVTKKTDMVGSVGVYCTIADWYGYFAEQGLKVRDVYAPQSTDKNLDYKQSLEGNDKLLEDELKVLAQEFIDTVSKNRADKLTSEDWQTGKMFYTKEAKKIGLIDGQMSIEQVYQRMDQLVKTNSKSSNNNTVMSYPKASKAAKTEGFQSLVPGVATEVAVAGVFVSDEAMGNIESALTDAEANTEAASQLAAAQADLNTANGNLATANTRITELENEVATLKKTDGAEPAAPGTKEEDDFVAAEPSASDMAFQKELLEKIN